MRENIISKNTQIKLNNGVEMPILGLGTWQIHGTEETEEAILYALDVGYRLLDTADSYGNEENIGLALRKSRTPREEIFITTKLWNSDHGYDSAIAACEKSLKRLGLSYIDLYLIHWPVKDLRSETWRAMETLLNEEKCRAIGVSNYMIWHLEELLGSSSTIPAVNQVEFNPYLYQKDLLEFCRYQNIQVEAYCPLAKGLKFGDPRLVSITGKYSKSPAQILIRWALQHGMVAIPKSSNKERIQDNTNVFDFTISSEDMGFLDSFNENLRTGWDPSTVQ